MFPSAKKKLLKAEDPISVKFKLLLNVNWIGEIILSLLRMGRICR